MNPAGFGAASWRPVRGREVGLLHQGLPRHIAPLQQSAERSAAAAAARFFTPAFAVEAPDYGPAPRSDKGSPQSALSGIPGHTFSRPSGLGALGTTYFNVAFCDSFQQAVEALGEVVRRADEAGVNSATLAQARKLYEDETSWFNRTPVSVVNCSARTAYVASVVSAANADLPSNRRMGLPPSVQETLNERNLDADTAGKPPEPMPDWAKYAIVGGISVVGLIGIAYITGQVGGVIRAFKK